MGDWYIQICPIKNAPRGDMVGPLQVMYGHREKKNHVIFGLFGLKCPVFAHAVFAPKTPKISDFSFQKQHHGPLGPTQVELRAYFGQRDPIGPENCLLGAFLRPRVGTEPISTKMTDFANFYQIWGNLAPTRVKFVCKMPKMTPTFFSRATSRPRRGQSRRRRWAFLIERI